MSNTCLQADMAACVKNNERNQEISNGDQNGGERKSPIILAMKNSLIGENLLIIYTQKGQQGVFEGKFHFDTEENDNESDL